LPNQGQKEGQQTGLPIHIILDTIPYNNAVHPNDFAARLLQLKGPQGAKRKHPEPSGHFGAVTERPIPSQHARYFPKTTKRKFRSGKS